MNLNDCVALITGGASGLGAATARLLLERGAKVVILDLNDALAESLVKPFKGRALYLRSDVTDEVAVSNAVKRTVASFGRIDLCVNAAGIVHVGLTASPKGPLPVAEFRRVMEVNLLGSFNVASQVAAVMIRQPARAPHGERGVIIHTGSVSGSQGPQGMVAYATSKGALAAMTLPMARDLSQYGIRVNTIAAGFFETPMSAGLSSPAHDAIVANIEFPKRGGEPSEYAALVSTIAENAYINGAVIALDGAAQVAAR